VPSATGVPPHCPLTQVLFRHWFVVQSEQNVPDPHVLGLAATQLVPLQQNPAPQHVMLLQQTCPVGHPDVWQPIACCTEPIGSDVPVSTEHAATIASPPSATARQSCRPDTSLPQKFM
jgi:hypothetical protein